MQPFYRAVVMGRLQERPSIFDAQLADDLLAFSQSSSTEYRVVKGKTLSCDDFYESQGRLDGAIGEVTDEDKAAFFSELMDRGVVNFEMESCVVSSFTRHLGIRAGMMSVTLLNRLHGDQPPSSKSQLQGYEQLLVQFVTEYIALKLK